MKDTAIPQLKIEAAGQTSTATMLDNPAARAQLEYLPMTVSMEKLNGNEKYFYLPEELPADARQRGTSAQEI